jgi:hypothetical protein
MIADPVDESKISIKEATVDDYGFFYSIKSEESNIYWTGHDQKPDYAGLERWFQTQIEGENRIIYIIFLEGIKVGYCYLDFVNDNQIEIGGLAICDKYQKKKIGSIAFKKFSRMISSQFSDRELIGWVPDINISSRKMVERSNFKPTEETKPYYWPLEDRTILIRKYVYSD